MGVARLACLHCRTYILLPRCSSWSLEDAENVRLFLLRHRTHRVIYICEDIDGPIEKYGYFWSEDARLRAERLEIGEIQIKDWRIPRAYDELTDAVLELEPDLRLLKPEWLETPFDLAFEATEIALNYAVHLLEKKGFKRAASCLREQGDKLLWKLYNTFKK